MIRSLKDPFEPLEALIVGRACTAKILPGRSLDSNPFRRFSLSSRTKRRKSKNDGRKEGRKGRKREIVIEGNGRTGEEQEVEERSQISVTNNTNTFYTKWGTRRVLSSLPLYWASSQPVSCLYVWMFFLVSSFLRLHPNTVLFLTSDDINNEI